MPRTAVRFAFPFAVCAAMLVACAGAEAVRNIDNERVPRGWGRIHRNYNGWIMNVNRDIQTRLSL